MQLEDNCLVNANELGDIYIHPLIYYSRVPNPYQQLCSSITSRWRTNNAGSYLIALATQMCTKHKVKRTRGEKLFQMFRTSKRKNSHLLMVLITFCVGYTIVRATRKKPLEPLFFDKLLGLYEHCIIPWISFTFCWKKKWRSGLFNVVSRKCYHFKVCERVQSLGNPDLNLFASMFFLLYSHIFPFCNLLA